MSSCANEQLPSAVAFPSTLRSICMHARMQPQTRRVHIAILPVPNQFAPSVKCGFLRAPTW